MQMRASVYVPDYEGQKIADIEISYTPIGARVFLVDDDYKLEVGSIIPSPISTRVYNAQNVLVGEVHGSFVAATLTAYYSEGGRDRETQFYVVNGYVRDYRGGDPGGQIAGVDGIYDYRLVGGFIAILLDLGRFRPS